MKLIQLIFTFVFGLFLLYYLWPLFLVFIVIIGIGVFRTFYRLRSVVQSQQPAQQPHDLSQDDDIEQPVQTEVIDAEYKERE